MDIEQIKKEYDELSKQLSNPELISDWPASAKATAGKEKFETLIKRKEFLEKIIAKEEEIKEIKNKIEENKGIISAKEDPELVSLAETELVQLQEKENILEKELAAFDASSKASFLPECEVRQAFGDAPSGREKEPSAVIIEIRAGTGGEEAALFASDLFKMYSKYAQLQGWKQKVLDSRVTELGGFKEIIFELKNGDVFSQMQYEGGVHRVQRIPETEKSGRIHTSTASVAVLPKPKKAEVKIKPDDLRVDFYRASGPGGQYVNKRETAVRITHLPSGLAVTSQTERNQLQNKENAMSILEARLLEKKQIKEIEEISGKRKTQIKWAKRAEKIRTYNFPQDRVTDHRIKKSWKKLEKILNGELKPIIETLQKVEKGPIQE